MKKTCLLAAGCLAAALPALGFSAPAQSDASLQQELNQLQLDYNKKLKELETRLDQLQQQQDQAAVAPASGSNKTEAVNSFNPAIALILSGQAAYFSQNPANYRMPGFALGDETDPGTEGLSLAESELAISADVDNWFYGQFVLSVTPDNQVSVEEAYLDALHMPAGLGLRFGRLKSGIGYLNDQHSHVWDFIDAPLAYRAMLNTQYADDGVRLTWLAPTDMFFELGSEVFNGSNYPAAGNAHHGVGGAYTVYAHFGGDVGVSNSWLAGLSHLSANARDRDSGTLGTFTGEDKVNIADLVWKWAPNGNPYRHNFKFQTEYLWGTENGTYSGIGDVNNNRRGWYAQAVYQFIPQWRVGARYGQVSADDPGLLFAGTSLDTAGGTPRRSSLMVDFSNSEFSHIRLQYNHDQSGPKTNNEVFLQYVMALGAHGAHAY